MATTLLNTIRLQNTVAPRLPAATAEYSQRFQDQFESVLRLYFNQIDNFGAGLVNGQYGGAILNFPFGAFHQDGTTTLSSGITNVSTTPISVASTTGFPSSGWILIGSEIISYTTKTATTLHANALCASLKCSLHCLTHCATE